MPEVSENVIRGCREGDVTALEEVYRVYGDRIHRLCLRICGHLDDAEDAVQQVFLRLLGHADKFSGRSLFSTWLFRLAVNTSLNTLRARSRKRLPSLEDVPEMEHPLAGELSPLETAEQAEMVDEAASLLQLLNPRQRSVLVLRELEGMSYREIADVLEVPVGTVMSRLARARERLAKEVTLAKEPAEPRNRSLGAGVQRKP